MKNHIVVGVLLAYCFMSCREESYTVLSGKTMGTYYSIQYKSGKSFQNEVDSILQSFISAASTYDSLSELSEFNRNGILFFRSKHLYTMLTIAKAIHKETNGAFEPTLMPLINAHGFGFTKRKSV